MRRVLIIFLIIHCGISKAQDEIHFMKTDEEKTSETETNLTCGVNNPSGLVFRFGDGLADFGEYPWMVAIIRKSETTEWSDKDYVSAGTLIHPSVVLTNPYGLAKIKPDELKCRAGEWHKNAEDENYLHQERNVRRIVSHQDYFKDSLHNAVSLVFLEKPFDFSDAPHIGVACVGQTLPEPGTRCFGTGWGNAAYTTKSDILKKIPVTLLSVADCETKLRETRVGKIFRLHDSLTCASSADDSCKSDVGAPLVCPVEGESTRYVLYGMSAYRIHQDGAPCAYVNVPAFYDWIGERMTEEGLNSKSYTYTPII